MSWNSTEEDSKKDTDVIQIKNWGKFANCQLYNCQKLKRHKLKGTKESNC